MLAGRSSEIVGVRTRGPSSLGNPWTCWSVPIILNRTTRRSHMNLSPATAQSRPRGKNCLHHRFHGAPGGTLRHHHGSLLLGSSSVLSSSGSSGYISRSSARHVQADNLANSFRAQLSQGISSVYISWRHRTASSQSTYWSWAVLYS